MVCGVVDNHYGSTREITTPGGRLTQQERQQIARGLADSLPYAEIARRLDRPTSTITREVMRNRSPSPTAPTWPHRATERRSHPHRAATSQGAQSATPPYGRDPEAVADYEETLTVVLMASGLSKMTAHVLASARHLLLSTPAAWPAGQVKTLAAQVVSPLERESGRSLDRLILLSGRRAARFEQASYLTGQW